MNKWARPSVSAPKPGQIPRYKRMLPPPAPWHNIDFISGKIRRKRDELDADHYSTDQRWCWWEYSRRSVEEIQSRSYRQYDCRDPWWCWRRSAVEYVDRSRCPSRKQWTGHVFHPVECRWWWCWRGGDHGHRGPGKNSDVEISYGLNHGLNRLSWFTGA